MIRILIADDESVVRTSLRTMVDWGREGYQIVDEAPNGRAALQLLETGDIHLLITDIRMPVMDGLALMRGLKKRGLSPVVIVLSAYDEYSLVREAFKLGAADYLLKSDITPQSLLSCVKSHTAGLAAEGPVGAVGEPPEDVSEQLRQAALGKAKPNALFDRDYLLACIEIDGFQDYMQRFGNSGLDTFVSNMLNFARQIPRIAAGCHICSLAASRYLLFYPAAEPDGAAQTLHSIVNQLLGTWKSYLNVNASVGISEPGTSGEDFEQCLEQAARNVSIKFVLGRGGIYSSAHYGQFNPKIALEEQQAYKPLVECLKQNFLTNLLELQHGFFARLYTLPLERARHCALCFLYHLSIAFINSGDDQFSVLHSEQNLYTKVTRLETVRDIEIWLTNLIRWTCDYVEHHYQNQYTDVIERAKRFMNDQFGDNAITLGAVASYVGLNEKYFSTKFTKETGMTFTGYLNELRISKAKLLMKKTDMKVYEISEQVGYQNVEHFNRIFKKSTGMSPSAYRQADM